jgi:2-dehydro-3-deoxyphosphogluconate aldolase / (4S)-4-hydroxy-2-oxoglutarate aldolase
MQRILDRRLVPVAVIDSVESAVPLAHALIRGGIDILEITFRTACAPECVRRIAGEVPEMMVGAGTLIEEAQVAEAKGCGASFGVAPGLSEVNVARAQREGLFFVPGVATASEIERALQHGLQILKFFPAEPMGGAKTLAALAGPFAHRGVRFIPLGGVNTANMAAYLRLPAVAAVGGSWMVERKLIASGRWDEVERLAAEAVQIVKANPAA